MALQLFAWGITVTIILISTGGNSLPACQSSPINSRIFGGQDAAPGSWPWHATFTYQGRVYCQGSLITDEWVLTAAQCSTQFYLSGAVVHLGSNNQSGFSEVTRGVDSIVCHTDMNFNNYENDICLVKLSAPVNFTAYIRPVCLASENSTFYDGTSSWVTSFGYTSQFINPNSLQEVDVSVIGNTKCNCSFTYYYYNYYYNNYYYYYRNITENMMCAGSEDGSRDAFYGDQGAALVTKQGSTWVQSGIASYVYDHYLGRPSIYTRVSQYQKWISSKVTGMEPGFVTFTSPGNDSDLNYSCPAPTTPSPTTYPYSTTTYPYSTTTYPYSTTTYPPSISDDRGSIFGSGETLIPITRFFPLSVFLLVLHLLVGRAGI